LKILLDLISLTKPRLAVLVVFTSSVGIAMAPGTMDLASAFEAVFWTSLVVAAGTTLNMVLEIGPDGRMERTRSRPLPAGRLRPWTAWALGLSLAAISLPMLALRVNFLTAALGAFALLVYLGVYTPLKPRSVAAVYAGAIPGATPILMGWTAATGTLDLPSTALFAILFLWQIPHFIAISLYRREEYAAAGFRTLPLEYGDRASLWHMLGTTIGLAVASALPAYFELGGALYRATAVILAAMALGGTLLGIRVAADVVWARRYFLTTLVYLPLLLGALVVDRL